MMIQESDTIAACATPPGRGGVGIIRVSGDKAFFIAEKLLGRLPKPRYAHFSAFKDDSGAVIDKGLAFCFKGPNSFTGEDVLELHGHGGPVVVDMLLQTILNLGVRMAKPGEFSERAFLNDKMDLAQAEAVADLIDAQSKHAVQSALRSLQGEFSEKINALKTAMINLRMVVEAAIDFPEDETDFLSDKHVSEELKDIIETLHAVKNSARQGVLLKEGMTVVIAGKPNAGKSSLLNQLSGEHTAIVTDVPGTTRDVLRQHIQIDGLPLHIVDTAGLRDSEDKIEQEGVRRAQQEIEKADRVLLVVDANLNEPVRLPKEISAFAENKPVTLVYNKIDLIDQGAEAAADEAREVLGIETTLQPSLGADSERQYSTIHLSAKTGEGMGALKAHLKTSMGFDNTLEGQFTARRRHVQALDEAHQHLLAGQEQLLTYRAGELLAEELRLAHGALGVITGEFRPDDLLGEIFSSFCIGK